MTNSAYCTRLKLISHDYLLNALLFGLFLRIVALLDDLSAFRGALDVATVAAATHSQLFPALATLQDHTIVGQAVLTKRIRTSLTSKRKAARFRRHAAGGTVSMVRTLECDVRN